MLELQSNNWRHQRRLVFLGSVLGLGIFFYSCTVISCLLLGYIARVRVEFIARVRVRSNLWFGAPNARH